MKLQQSSKQYLDMAYDGLQDRNLARMAIGLRTPDYGELLPQMLQSLDQNNRSDPRYLGWARHAYNDVAK
jgi:ribosomal protein L16 Arg81 hydroxylase